MALQAATTCYGRLLSAARTESASTPTCLLLPLDQLSVFPPPLVSNTLCHEIRREEIPQETHPASGTAVEIASLARMTMAPDATLNVTMAETGATHPILGGVAKIELEVRGGMGIGMGMGGTG